MINLKTVLYQFNTSGKLTYEYNPFHNFRLDTDIVKNGTVVKKAGSLEDLDTDKLNFDINHPVDILPQTSYDGSVNLILNDNKNVPRLINSRFTVEENDTYEVVDRRGNNDTNIYDEDTFDTDTSLYKRILNIPQITYNGVTEGGNMSVGNYVFYIRYCDADDNETDFVAESGIVSCFMGTDCAPKSINGGYRDDNSNKMVNFTINNIDNSYDYLKIYYTRTTSDVDQNQIVKAFKIQQKYPVYNKTCYIHISGLENTDEISLSDINVQYFMVKQAKSQAISQNMLFLGNVIKPDIRYTDLTDISLRITPSLKANVAKNIIGECDYQYNDNTGINTPYEYYNTQNIYYHVGYWNEEIYRLGIVYILKDNTLSPVYNIRGKLNLSLDSQFSEIPTVLDENSNRQYIQYDEQSYIISGTADENSKGVIRLNDSRTDSNLQQQLYSIGINIPQEVINYLQTIAIGFFIVRQKRIPTILTQAYTVPRDDAAQAPIIPLNSYNVEESFVNKNRILLQTYRSRLRQLSDSGSGDGISAPMKLRASNAYAAICPEYSNNASYYNQLFSGSNFKLRYASNNYSNQYLNSDSSYERHYYNCDMHYINNSAFFQSKLIGIDNHSKVVSIDDYEFRGSVGEAEMAYRFRYIGNDNQTNEANNLIRGVYNPYLGGIGKVNYGQLLNIYIPEYSLSNISNYFKIRYEDNSPYYPISDRITFHQVEASSNNWTYSNSIYSNTFYRGDCFICNYTHRLNYNFQAPSSPNNSAIVDSECWKDNYGIVDTEKLSKINLGDVNAIQLGSWITFKICSSTNLSIRSVDHSNISEEALTGHGRTFYPLQSMSVSGEYKVPESTTRNKGFDSLVGKKEYFMLPDSPVVKNKFETRIIYSDIAPNDAFKNGFRTFKLTSYRDYPMTYGAITKIIEFSGNLIVIFEKGVGLIPINERAVAGQGDGGNVFINTSNVLPQNPKILSNMYGSSWPESVLKTPTGIYGIDTVAKKIWKTDGETLTIISDFHVEEFLINHITLNESDKTPIIGVRNVKTHYNAWKGDIMFTFYDSKYGFEEEAWNLCYNEKIQNWSTLYSWIPSYSANISNIFFSYNRDSSKFISKLAQVDTSSDTLDGIVLQSGTYNTGGIIDDISNPSNTISIPLQIVNRQLPLTVGGSPIICTYSLQRDIYKNYLSGLFSINNNNLVINDLTAFKQRISNNYLSTNRPLLYINIKYDIDTYLNSSTNSDLYNKEQWDRLISQNLGQYQATIALTCKSFIQNSVYDNQNQLQPNFTTDFWKHGFGGIIDIQDDITPCHWYGRQHPFEIEFICNDKSQYHKVFNNLEIIGNNAEPESFHYEVIGDSYDFANDKKNMFIRQEATRDFYQYNGSDITYDRNFLSLNPEQNKRSTLLPLYYSRQNTLDNIYDNYNEIEEVYHNQGVSTKSFKDLAGGELLYYKKLNEYRIWNHCKAYSIDKYSRLRGNMQYLEDKWFIQINPLFLCQKNEYSDANLTISSWNNNKIPITIANIPVPKDFNNISQVTFDSIPADLRNKNYVLKDIDLTDWNTLSYNDSNNSNSLSFNSSTASGRQSVKMKDKWIKVRIRYSGEKLAIITAIKTLYNITT